jgi:hypothetical protein
MMIKEKKVFKKTWVEEPENPNMFCAECGKEPVNVCDGCNEYFEDGEEIYCVNKGEEHFCEQCGSQKNE